MKSAPSPVVRHLAIALAVKLAVLVALWWVFVRDARVAVGPAELEARLAAPAAQGAAR